MSIVVVDEPCNHVLQPLSMLPNKSATQEEVRVVILQQKSPQSVRKRKGEQRTPLAKELDPCKP